MAAAPECTVCLAPQYRGDDGHKHVPRHTRDQLSYCMECDEILCPNCWRNEHQNLKRRHHQPRPLPSPPVAEPPAASEAAALAAVESAVALAAAAAVPPPSPPSPPSVPPRAEAPLSSPTKPRGGYSSAAAAAKERTFCSNVSLAEQAAAIMDEQWQEEDSVADSDEAEFLRKLCAEDEEERRFLAALDDTSSLSRTEPKAVTEPSGSMRMPANPVLMIERSSPQEPPLQTPPRSTLNGPRSPGFSGDMKLLTPACPPTRHDSSFRVGGSTAGDSLVRGESTLGIHRGRSSVVYEPLQHVNAARAAIELAESQREPSDSANISRLSSLRHSRGGSFVHDESR
eukprot:TRINITY_DN18674_c2_g1_i1.p1 TRINITY_DN18674_c2_g1~~TRINITY_DN18674_c2_g1_i1.p1  ORF type:complete len:360 (+),score=105.62 TRINITY_DN18674_c2_g1_i1:56-1081(+)